MAKSSKKRKRFFIKLLQKIWNHDVVLGIYASFAVVLVLTGLLTSYIFMQLYQKNYVGSYTELLTKQGKIISKRVAGFADSGAEPEFEDYNAYVDELEQAENTDVWIIANDAAKEPLSEKYVNAMADSENVSEGTLEVLKNTFKKGKVFSDAKYDSTYGQVTLSVAIPIKGKKIKETNGAVLMVSMIKKQTMGLDEGRYILFVSLLFSIIVAYIVAALFSKILSGSLAKLSKHIAKLAEGDYEPVVVAKPQSQIGLLEKSLENLSGKLRRAKKERDELEQIRMDFFANVSHELRTPITVIRGYTETLSDGVIEEKEQVDELYKRMLAECQGIERLVEDLFLLSKIQNPEFQIEMEPVSLQQIFGDISRSVEELGREKNIQWNFRAPDEPCLVLGDYGRLRQMFLVILDNAIKFSNENDLIEITIEREEEKFSVCIRDYGVGIKKEELPYIFEKFYTSKMRQNKKGTGLGLMIAQKIANRHGSDIRVESEEGKGSSFLFRFDECTSTEDFD